MGENNDSYKQIFKATSIFGGVQVFNILIAIVRSKFVAILLGPAGIGAVALFTSTIGFISSLTNFGLSTSAVKNIAASANYSDKAKLGKTVAVFRRLVWITGFTGLLLTLIFSPFLSNIAFGTYKYTTSFRWLSVTLLVVQINAGQNVILQGLRKINYLAKSNLFGALLGLIIAVPFYYFFREKGIIPVIIITAFSSLLISWYFARKVQVEKPGIGWKDIKQEGNNMLTMGVLISMSNIITIAIAYIVRIFISKNGGVLDVGLYSSGFTIISVYVGLVFDAMSKDYFPRLSTFANDDLKSKMAINQQAEIAVLILAPILIIFIVFVHWAVIVLYSKEFLGVVSMVQWAALGIFFKAISWCIAFLFLAKGIPKVFFWNELIANIYILAFNLIGYKYGGLTGLGVSFLFAYFIYFLQVYIISRKLYNFSFDKSLIRIFLLQFFIALLCFCIVKFLKGNFAYVLGSLLIIFSMCYSWIEMNKRVALNSLIRTLINKNKR